MRVELYVTPYMLRCLMLLETERKCTVACIGVEWSSNVAYNNGKCVCICVCVCLRVCVVAPRPRYTVVAYMYCL